MGRAVSRAELLWQRCRVARAAAGQYFLFVVSSSLYCLNQHCTIKLDAGQTSAANLLYVIRIECCMMPGSSCECNSCVLQCIVIRMSCPLWSCLLQYAEVGRVATHLVRVWKRLGIPSCRHTLVSFLSRWLMLFDQVDQHSH